MGASVICCYVTNYPKIYQPKMINIYHLRKLRYIFFIRKILGILRWLSGVALIQDLS
jgi:hypothetical protein